MDPWIASSSSSSSSDHHSQSSPDLELHNNPATTTTTTKSSPDNINSSEDSSTSKSFFFDDDFQPQPSTTSAPAPPSFAESKPFSKLPDSDQYLASLEKRLEKVQKATGKKEPARILQGLSQTKESCMIKLLSNSLPEGNSSIEEFLADEVKVNLLLKKLAPERQAISAEELIHLLTADQLELTLESTEVEEDSSVKPEK